MEPSGTEARESRIGVGEETPSVERPTETPTPFPRARRSIERARRALDANAAQAHVPAEFAPASLQRRLPSVDVVVVTHNSRDDLERYVPALERAAEEIGAGIIFVDNASEDGSAGWVLGRERLNSEVIELAENRGYAAAVNVGADSSDADYLIVLNPDVRVPSGDALWHLVDYLERTPEAAVASPRLHGPDGAPQASIRVVPTVPMLLARQTALGRTRLGRRLGGNYLSPAAAGDRPVAVEWALGAALAIRRSDFDRVGGWDERYFLYFEDVDFCFRLRAAGRQIHHVPSVSMTHDYRRESRREAGPASRSAARRAHYRSALRFFRRYPHLAFLRRREANLAPSWAEATRRTIDIVVSALLLFVLSPLLAAIAFAVRFDSAGPALFRQRRIGRGGKPFTVLKFRTMAPGSDTAMAHDTLRKHVYGHSSWTDGDGRPVFKPLSADGMVVTRFGRLLRRWSLDELPQLVNVLRGEMSLVGYRPPVGREINHYPDWYFGRFVIKPGLTGIWQVSGRNGKSYPDMVRWDIEYVMHRSWLLDLKLLARTIPAILTRRGAY